MGARNTVSFDGGEGVDVFQVEGPSHRVFGRGSLVNVERIVSLNDQFDTLLVLGDFVHAAEGHEIDVVSDPFDTIILDPNLNWEKTLHSSTAFDVYSSVVEGESISVLVAPGSFVVFPESLSGTESTAGPNGPLRWPSDAAAEAPKLEVREDIAEITWSVAGAVKPSVRNLDGAINKVVFNFDNGAPNLIIVNLGHLKSRDLNEIQLTADPFDFLLLNDGPCWTIQGHPNAQLMALSNSQQDDNSARVIVPKKLFERRGLGDWRVGKPEASGTWLLSNDTQTVLDAIDLRNGGKDTLILRNDGRLRLSHGTIFGDPGDEVWLEGTAGWRLETGPFGTLAKLPEARFELGDAIIRFSPGLRVRLMPLPDFLNDPSLLKLSHYPGAINEVRIGRHLLVTRGGYVGFSSTQLTNIEKISLDNGLKNILRITPMNLGQKTGILRLGGDEELDIVIAEGLPEAIADDEGGHSWLLENENGSLRIIVESLEVIQKNIP